MTAIQFYHLTATPLERALPKLLEKAYGGGFKILLVAESDERVEQLNHLLWTYAQLSFLPHGSAKDGNVEKQPILLITNDKLGLFSPCLRGELEGGDVQPHHGKIGEGEYSSRKPEAMDHAKELRQNATDAENKLWYFLQKGNLGCSFRRQHPIGNYIVDFTCIAKHLIVELDGGQHSEQREYDAERTTFLEKAGYKVLRFWNNDVLGNSEGVLQTIQTALNDSSNHPPYPPASGGVKEFNLLAITDGTMPEKPEAFERIIDMFDGHDPQAVEKARTRWKTYKNTGHSIAYLYQNDAGAWEQKAVA